ncbi:MAG: hypothetical protein Q7S87_10310 [Agitococcus sp.]|nr:hypothetical protein [Agitococcus sp.]
MKKISLGCLAVGVLLGVVAAWAVEKYELNYDHLMRGRHWVRWTEQVPLPSGDTLVVDRAIFVMPGAGAAAKYAMRFRDPYTENHSIVEWATPAGTLIPVGLYRGQSGHWRVILDEWLPSVPNPTCSAYIIFQFKENGVWEQDQKGPSAEDVHAFVKGLNLKIVNDNTGKLHVVKNEKTADDQYGHRLNAERKSASDACRK